MQRLPDLIEVNVSQQSDVCTLRIDGEEFPYYITDAGVSTTVRFHDIPHITITIPCIRLSLVADLD